MTDELLKGLGRAVREEEALGERLDALAERLGYPPAAEADGAETKSLEAAALGVDVEAVRSAYAPLSAEEKARLSASLLAQVRAAAARANRDQHPRARGSRVWLAGAALAAAAVVALWLGLRPGPEPIALAAYELDVQGSAAFTRGDDAPASPAEPLRVSSGSALSLVLSPERTQPGPVTARAYLYSTEGTSVPEQRLELAPSGAVRLTIAPGTSWPASGVLMVWLGRPEILNEGTGVPSAASAERGVGYQRFVRQFVRVP